MIFWHCENKAPIDFNQYNHTILVIYNFYVYKSVWVHQSDNGAKLGIMPRPRGNDWLNGEINSLYKQRVGLLISLLEESEILELGLKNENQICTQNNIQYINFPIPDREAPARNNKLDILIEEIEIKVKAGFSVVIHCRMGIGRSSIIAGALLRKHGVKTEQIVSHITKVRGLQVPDTDQQITWLKNVFI